MQAAGGVSTQGSEPSSYHGSVHIQSADQNLPSCGRNPLDAGWERT